MPRLYLIFALGVLLPLAVLPTRTTVHALWARPAVQAQLAYLTDATDQALVALVRHTQRVREMATQRTLTITSNGTPVPLPAAVALDTSDDFRLTHGQSLDAAAIDAILSDLDSPAAGTGAAWVAAGQRTGIDAAYVLAMFIAESRAGTDPRWAGHTPDGRTTHNVGNLICAGYPTCFGGFRTYPDWHSGIDASFDLLAAYRDRQGIQTIGAAIYTWAPPTENDTAAYVTEVERLVSGWRSIQAAPADATGLITGVTTHPVTADMRVTAGFHAVNCAYWGGQPGCQHLGTDYALVDGQPVFAPVPGTVVTVGAYPENDPALRTGAYIIYLTDDGYELYAGHLKHIPAYQPGQRLHAGATLGYGRGDLAHVHIQLTDPTGQLTDFEPYYRERSAP